MIYWRKIFCWLRGIYRTLKTGTWLHDNVVAGHQFVETEPEGKPVCVQILECRTCGTMSMSWTRE